MSTKKHVFYELSEAEENVLITSDHHDWFVFSYNYLDLAEAGCEKVLAAYKKEEQPNSVALIIPIVYNIKHALEISTKFFSKVVSNQNGAYTHNLSELLKNFKKAIRSKLSKAKQKELDADIEALEGMIIYYFRMTPLKKYINSNFFLEDVDNILLKYPGFNEVKFKLSFADILESINQADITRIRNEILEIKRIFLSIHSILTAKN